MIRFPVFETFSVNNYRLYPGKKKDFQLKIDFSNGPWICLGVNGLGKSTLLLLMKHTLTGPIKIREAGFAGERTDFVNINNKLFSSRVNDGARNASSTAVILFGEQRLSVSRNLSNQSLINATLSDSEKTITANSENEYRKLLTSAMGLERYEDALKLLELVTFYLEDRTDLIWDLSAQFELFKALLTPETSEKMRRLEGQIISHDSTSRNFNANLSKLIKKRKTELNKLDSEEKIKKEVNSLAETIQQLISTEVELDDKLQKYDQDRLDQRIEYQRIESKVDATAGNYERLKLSEMKEEFRLLEPNLQYIYLKILSDENCLVCGSEKIALKDDHCIVCGKKNKTTEPPSKSSEDITNDFGNLAELRKQLIEKKQTFSKAEEEFSKVNNKLIKTKYSLNEKRQKLRSLEKKLPSKDKSGLDLFDDDIKSHRRLVQEFKNKREEAELKLVDLIVDLKHKTENVREQIEINFNLTAKQFFSEDVRLVYSPRKTRIGQGEGGTYFEFPAFDVEMTSSSTEGQFVRRKSDQVSLSQREYLDIIFRITLVNTLANSGCSIIIDGPEGSVDAIFSERAGNLFANIANKNNNNNVILACNIVEGSFIPQTLSNFTSIKDREKRLINLINIGAETSALKELSSEYLEKLDVIIKMDLGV